MELRETIEALRARNEEAQAVIQGALNNPDNTKGLEINQKIFSVFFLSLCVPISSCCFFLFTRSANATTELMREHLQSQQSNQYVEYWQPERPRCQEEEEKELGKEPPPQYEAMFCSHNQSVLVHSPQWWHSSMNLITAARVTGLSLLCVVLCFCFRSLRWVLSLFPNKATAVVCHSAWWAF